MARLSDSLFWEILYANYDENAAKVILENCDTMVYLGGGNDGADASKCKEISSRLGKRTIHTRNVNINKGSNDGSSLQNSIQQRDLLMPDEVARLPRDEEIVIIKNAYPFKDRKFVLEKHKRYCFIDPESHNHRKSLYPGITSNFNFKKYRDKFRKK